MRRAVRLGPSLVAKSMRWSKLPPGTNWNPIDMATAGDQSITSEILTTIARKKTCNLEDLLQCCTSYTWNQVFLEVDRLSRTGELRLEYKRDGDYALRLPRRQEQPSDRPRLPKP